jgi:hypothetical protein
MLDKRKENARKTEETKGKNMDEHHDLGEMK